jgi:uncharacterized protein (DUF849 family)
VADGSHGYRDCPRAEDFTRLSEQVDELEIKVFRGNGNSLETRMSLVQSDLSRIAAGMEKLVATEATAMKFINGFQTRESTREHDKADRAGEVKTDLEMADKKKDRSLYVIFSAAAIFVTLLVGVSAIGITVHEDHMMAQYQQSIRNAGVNK